MNKTTKKTCTWYKAFNASKGITLIALVITIIVMLILVAVTISLAINGGLFSYAGKAAGETNIKKEEENRASRGWFGGKSIHEYVTGEKPVVNPYEEKECTSAWAVINDEWTDEIKSEEPIPENTRMVVKMYEKEVETEANGCNPAGTKTMYQFVVEGQGEMPPYVPASVDDIATSVWGKYELVSSLAGGTIDEVYVCDGVTSIADNAFGSSGYKALEKVEISYTVSNIGDVAFYLSESLKNITLRSGVTNIGNNAFWKSGLENVIIPENVQNIGVGAFRQTQLESTFILTKDASKISIGSGAFLDIKSGSTIYILDNVPGLEEKLNGTYDANKTSVVKVNQQEMNELIEACKTNN